METELGLHPTNIQLLPELKETFEWVLQNVGEEDYIWYHWIIISKQHHRIIGGILIKGAPNAQGEIEIGYGTDDGFEGKGFMTEALKALIRWAFEQPRVLAVTAETEKTNLASIRVLQKIGMTQYKEVDEMLWWRINKSKE